MADAALQGRRILVAEDEYLLADDLSRALAAAGATVVGPVGSADEAAAIVLAGTSIDAAVLDVNLRGTTIFSVADLLAERGIPFAFATGYDRWALPERFAGIPWVEKPVKAHAVAAILSTLLEVEVDR